MRYFRRRWDETRGDAYEDWGPATYFFETDDDLQPIRQVEVYAKGRVLRYDRDRPEDEFGMLTDQPLDHEGFAPYEVTQAVFDRAWRT